MTDPARLLDVLRVASDALTARGYNWALIGGLAVSIRTEPRFTRDIDLAVAVADDAAAESLVADLVSSGFSLLLSLEQEALGRLAAVRMLPPGGNQQGVVLDLLFSSSGIEPDICRQAETVEVVPGLVIPVARTGHLVAMKVLSARAERPQDAMDLRALVSALSSDERNRAVAAVARIEKLGANRGKPLRADLERWINA